MPLTVLVDREERIAISRAGDVGPTGAVEELHQGSGHKDGTAILVNLDRFDGWYYRGGSHQWNRRNPNFRLQP